MAYKTINPFTNEIVKEFPNATDSQIAEALTTTHNLYRVWKKEKSCRSRTKTT